MENRAILILGLLSFVLFLSPVGWGYDDAMGEAHQAINRAAIEYFEKTFFREDGKDPYLRFASFNEERWKGIDWGPEDGTRNLFPRIEVAREKTIREWLIGGGFSADEPEGPMALLHFYDPTNSERPYLTDQQFLVRLIRFLGGTTFDNPQRDAVTWTFRTRPEDTMEFLGLFDQEYGWLQAKEYLKKAIESKDPKDLYGKAWRAVGEVMHMVADMTVPAHVRNDGHAAILGDPDPYERGTSGDHLREALERGRPANLKYFRFDAEALMKDVASYTNANFFSQDTIPGRYTLPSLEKLEDGRDGYLYSTTTDGHRYRALAKGGFLDRWWRRRRYAIDRRVVEDQQSILLPTAVRACAGVLYAFLPRFDVKASVAPVAGKEGVFEVVGEITHHLNFQWQERFTIRNGVFVVVERGKEKTRIPVKNFLRQDLNSFSVEVEAEEDDAIFVEYDCGGYVIRSPQEDPSGTYRGEILFADPNLEKLGLRNYRVPFTLTLTPDGKATMTYKHEGSLEIPLGEGQSIRYRFASEAELEGTWKGSAVSMTGEERGWMEVVPPSMPPELTRELQDIAPGLGTPQRVESSGKVSIEAQVRGDTVEGKRILEGYPTPQPFSGKKEKNP
ncbi:hypothetical protein [Candidatus Caldatribacterium saccharofermentans]|uniref:hypothetical protein n=1 Tax=Candidatus Caldatribacterium saccharofermentans TaxID=1454753 RepID=UPI003D08AE93